MKPTKFHTQKSFDFSYPTSTNATRFGFRDKGCWTVNLVDPTGKRTPVAVSGHSTECDALEAAKKLPQPFTRLMQTMGRELDSKAA